MSFFKFYFLIFFITIGCNHINENSKKDSVKIDYYQNGKVKSIENDKNEQEKQIIWFDSTGNIQSIQKYNDTSREGQSIWFYLNGNVQSAVIFKNGKANGNAFYFYNDGAIKTHGYWKENKMVGYSTDYYQDSIGLIKDVFFYDSAGKFVNKKSASHPGTLPR